MRKLVQNDRGETLVEVMLSILIGTLSVALLFSCVAASFRMDAKVKTQDRAYYEGLAKADSQATPVAPATAAPAGIVTVERIDPTNPDTPIAAAAPDIEIYGDAGVYSYKGK